MKASRVSVILTSLIFGLTMLARGGAAPAQAAVPRTYARVLQELVDSAKAANPSYQAAGLKARAAGLGPQAAGSLDAPQLGVEFYQSPISSFPNPLKDQMEIDWSIQQMIPFPGKLSAMARAERAGYRAAVAEKQGTEQGLVADVKRSFAGLYFAWRRQEAVALGLASLRSLKAVTMTRYSVGMAGQEEVLRAETELASLESESIAAEQDVASMTAMVNALVNRPAEAAIEPVPEFTPDSVKLDYPALCSLATGKRADLAAMAAEVRMRDAEAQARLLEFLPDLMARGTYKQMTNAEDDWALMLGITVPFSWAFPKLSAEYRQKHLASQQARLELENMRNMAFAEVRDLSGKAGSLWRQLALLRGTVVPAARQTFETSLAQYRNGNADFLMVIDSHQMYLMKLIDYQMTVMSYLQTTAALERAVGTEL